VSPTSGQGETAVTLTLAANTVANSRTATLTVNGQRFSVPQDAAPCHYSLDSSAASVGAAGGPIAVGVSATQGCTWTATTHDAWLRVQTANGSGSGTATIAVDQNTGDARTGQVSIASQAFTVTQDAYTAPAPGPSPSPLPSPTPAPSPSPTPTPSPLCTYTLSSYTKDFGGKGGDGGFKVNTSDGCSWSASSDSGWISVTAGSGSGTGDVKYGVDKNPSHDVRTGTISVAGQVYTITQKGS
jgi:hypothetical protein